MICINVFIFLTWEYISEQLFSGALSENKIISPWSDKSH